MFGVTAPTTAESFLRGQLHHFAQAGWHVQLVCGEAGLERFARAEQVSDLFVVRAARQPSLRDPLTFALLAWRLWRARPAIAVMGTPKLGVLGTLAARLVGVPTRIYLVHGLRAEGLAGARRYIMRRLERLACRAATHVVAVSPSLRSALVIDGIVDGRRVRVLGAGSANGVDLQRFLPRSGAQGLAARTALAVPSEAKVVSFVGRLGEDKGLCELPGVWQGVLDQIPDAWLIVAGEPEPSTLAGREALGHLRDMERVTLLGHIEAVEDVYRASDVHLMMSKREGLGMVALEAAACGVPTVAYAVTGVVDSVVPGVSGLLIEPMDQGLLIKSIVTLLCDDNLRSELGLGAIGHAQQFQQEQVWAAWDKFLWEAGAYQQEQASQGLQTRSHG